MTGGTATSGTGASQCPSSVSWGAGTSQRPNIDHFPVQAALSPTCGQWGVIRPVLANPTRKFARTLRTGPEPRKGPLQASNSSLYHPTEACCRRACSHGCKRGRHSDEWESALWLLQDCTILRPVGQPTVLATAGRRNLGDLACVAARRPAHERAHEEAGRKTCRPRPSRRQLSSSSSLQR